MQQRQRAEPETTQRPTIESATRELFPPDPPVEGETELTVETPAMEESLRTQRIHQVFFRKLSVVMCIELPYYILLLVQRCKIREEMRSVMSCRETSSQAPAMDCT